VVYELSIGIKIGDLKWPWTA